MCIRDRGNYNTYATAADGSVVATEHSIEAKNVTKDKLNYAATLQLTYNLTRQFGLTADATIATRFPRISEYAGTGPTLSLIHISRLPSASVCLAS